MADDTTCTPEEARAVEEWEAERFFSAPGMADFVRGAVREQVAEWEAKDQEAEEG